MKKAGEPEAGRELTPAICNKDLLFCALGLLEVGGSEASAPETPPDLSCGCGEHPFAGDGYISTLGAVCPLAYAHRKPIT